MDWTTLLIGGAAAGVVLFFWAAIAWMALPHHHRDYRTCPDKEAVERAIATLPPRDAWYVLPHMNDYPGGMKDPALAERMRSAPSALLMVCKPSAPMGPGTFGRSLVLNLTEGIGLAVLVTQMAGEDGDLITRVVLCLGAALFVAAASPLSLANWRASPWRFAWTSTFDKLVGYGLAGVVLHFLL